MNPGLPSVSNLTELPFRQPGRAFRSVMPFSAKDPGGAVFKQYIKEGVKAVVLLVSDQECLEKTGFNLKDYYVEQGLEVIHLPISDFSIPSQAELSNTVKQVCKRLEAGQAVAIHCYAGIGRTGLFTACLAKRLLELPGEEAIFWIRQFIPNAVETTDQIRMVLTF